MYTKNELLNALFFDIETAAQYKSFDDLYKTNPELGKLWLKRKDIRLKKNPEENYLLDDNQYYLKFSPLYPEFGRIISICFGLISEKEGKIEIRTTCYENTNELELLAEVSDAVFTHKKLSNYILAGFNIKTFDIPFVSKRMLTNKLFLPKQFDNRGKKPWELKVLDLMDDWKMGSNDIVSLELLCIMFGVPSSKDTIQNDQVGQLYWSNPKENLPLISKYNEKDVIANIKCCLSISDIPY